LITKYSNQNNLDPDLVASIILQESGGNPNAYSKSGACGILQVMPRDGIAAKFGVFKNRPTIKELMEPEFNIEYGTNMFRGLVDRYGGEREALFHYGSIGMGYNYADKVLTIYNKYKK
jgi:soluble lytic murein transglycosylase-like protein